MDSYYASRVGDRPLLLVLHAGLSLLPEARTCITDIYQHSRNCGNKRILLASPSVQVFMVVCTDIAALLRHGLRYNVVAAHGRCTLIALYRRGIATRRCRSQRNKGIGRQQSFGYVVMSQFMENLDQSRRVAPYSLRDVNGPAALGFGPAVDATGGPMETWVMGVGLRPDGKPSDEPPNPKPAARPGLGTKGLGTKGSGAYIGNTGAIGEGGFVEGITSFPGTIVGRGNVAGVVLFAHDDNGQPNDKWESHAGGVGQARWSRPCVRVV